MALICASHREEHTVIRALEGLSGHLRALDLPQLSISAPVPRYPERVAGRTRWQLILESHQRRALQQALDACEPWVQENRARLYAQIEVDPLSLT
jgi:primosomal protein N'